MDNSIIIIFLIAWLVFRFVGSANRKKAGNRQGQQQPGQQQGAPGQAGQQPALPGQTPRQQQAAELQKRLREAYEAAQQQQQAQDDIPPYRRVAEDDDIPPYRRDSEAGQAEVIIIPARPPEKHHLDEAEEERCAEAARAKEEQRQQQHPARAVKPPGGRMLRPQAQAAQQLSATAPLSRDIPAASASSAPSTKRLAALAPQLPREALQQGIIMAEILGPPRAKKRRYL